MSLISMARLWCGIIIEANIASASLCGPDAGVAAAVVAEVLDAAVEGIEPMSWALVEEPQPASINGPSAAVGAMSLNLVRACQSISDSQW